MHHSVDELDPVAITKLLKGSVLTGGADVVAIGRRAVGEGQVASCWLLDLTIEGRSEPVSVVVKCPMDDPTSRATANALHLYEKEVRFYELVARDVLIRTPTCFAASYDEATGGFLLVLESMLPSQPSDQLIGLTPEVAAVALRELAGLHAPTWGSASERMAFTDDVSESLRPFYLQVLPDLFTGFLDRYGDQVTAGARAVIEWLKPRLGTYLAGKGGPQSVIHGDFRTDNLIFGGQGGAVPMATVDWQTVARGCCALDVAYLLTTSVTPADRRAHEDELLATYHDRLRSLGVADYDATALREDYVWHAFQGVVMLVCSAMLVVRTERGDAMFLEMIERSATAVDDLGARARWEA